MEFTVFTSKSGLKAPYKGVSPLRSAGMFTTLHNWRVRGGVLTLQDGFASIGNASVATNLKMMTLFVTSAGANRLVFVRGQRVRYFDLGTLAEVEIAKDIITTDIQLRMGYTHFAGRLLIATSNNGLWAYDGETNTLQKSGMSNSGATAPAGAAGAAAFLNGDYKLAYTWVNSLGQESNLSAPMAVAVTVANQLINWSGIAAGPVVANETTTVKRNIYRTTAGGSTYFYRATFNDNVTTTLVDSNLDDSLGFEAPAENTVPPQYIRQIASNSEHVYLVDDSDGVTLWSSSIDPETAYPNYGSFPASLSLRLPFSGGADPFQAVIPAFGDLFAMGRISTHRITGDVATGVKVEKVLDSGLLGRYTWTVTPFGIVYLDNFNRLQLLNVDIQLENLGEDFQSILNTIVTGTSLSGPSLDYDPISNAILINYSTGAAGSSNTKNLIFELGTRQLSTGTAGWDIATYADNVKNYFGSRLGSSLIYKQTGYKFIGSQAVGQEAQFIGVTPTPGKEFYCRTINMLVKATPIVTAVPPTLRVQVGVNTGYLFDTSYMDMTSDFMVGKAGAESVIKHLKVPVFKTVNYVTLKLSTVNNNASLDNGVEIFEIWLDGEEVGALHDDDKQIGRE